MTRPGYVMVEHPIEEAEALLSWLEQDTWTDDEFPLAAAERLQTAVNIERLASGNSEKSDNIEELARQLVDRPVKLQLVGTGEKIGTLLAVRDSATLELRVGHATYQSVALSRVRSIKAAA